jgi:hypothetical protein
LDEVRGHIQLANDRRSLTANTNTLNQLETQLSTSAQPPSDAARTQELIDMLRLFIEQQARVIAANEQQHPIHHHHHHHHQDVDMKRERDPDNEIATPDQLPPIRVRNVYASVSGEGAAAASGGIVVNQDDSSLLILDGRSIRVQPDKKCMIKYSYTSHELFCDTRSKDIYLDSKRVAKMGDPSKEVQVGGRKCRLMYMGRRCELWIDGVAFTFRADSPPKQISVRSVGNSGVIKRYYVTVESKFFFFNFFLIFRFVKVSIYSGHHLTVS